MCIGALGEIIDSDHGLTTRRINDQTRADFFQAIEDRKPHRIEGLQRQYSSKELKRYISKMERYGCHQEADLAREALKRK